MACLTPQDPEKELPGLGWPKGLGAGRRAARGARPLSVPSLTAGPCQVPDRFPVWLQPATPARHRHPFQPSILHHEAPCHLQQPPGGTVAEGGPLARAEPGQRRRLPHPLPLRSRRSEGERERPALSPLSLPAPTVQSGHAGHLRPYLRGSCWVPEQQSLCGRWKRVPGRISSFTEKLQTGGSLRVASSQGPVARTGHRGAGPRGGQPSGIHAELAGRFKPSTHEARGLLQKQDGGLDLPLEPQGADLDPFPLPPTTLLRGITHVQGQWPPVSPEWERSRGRQPPVAGPRATQGATDQRERGALLCPVLEGPDSQGSTHRSPGPISRLSDSWVSLDFRGLGVPALAPGGPWSHGQRSQPGTQFPKDARQPYGPGEN
ncbi:galectin-12 isoform X1 [Monodelphis domestica]|uniref:galectin-12 isoform X1 n=1 Tax=Monodelphis domestica TaxID=13616 RepID=UPI0024E1E982|nr:galectin-12 isoform X1 [Monodelphis domestica]